MREPTDQEIREAYQAHLPMIRKWMAELGTKDREALEQESYLAVWEALKRYDPQHNASFRTYLRYWLKKFFLQYLHDHEPLNKGTTTMIPIPVSTDKVRSDSFADSRFDSLPMLEKTCLTLYIRDHKSLSEIADIMQLPREKVRQLKEKALRRLRTLLLPPENSR